MASTDKVCFDRIPPAQQRSPHAGRMLNLSVGKSRAAFQIAKLWTNGATIGMRFIGGSSDQHETVRRFAGEWTEHANLVFDFDAGASAQVRIAFNDDGAWSYIGTDALGIPADQPTMNFGWLDQGVVLHEFGHMIGMIHEHQNPLDNPIQWNKPVVNAALSGPPNFWDQATIEHNMYAKYDVNQINGSELDPQSVMLYSFPASWTSNGFHTNPNERLSAVDKAFAQRVYPPTARPPSVAELSVYEGPTHAGIGQPGEEDLFRFTARKPGRYTIETSGSTDVVMTLYGPGNERIAQDDDGGQGRNSKIVTDLIPGEYQVQIRHYNTRGGTGDYAISVERS